MKRRILSLALAVLMVAVMVPAMTAAGSVQNELTDGINARNRAFGYAYMYATSPGRSFSMTSDLNNENWDSGVNHIGWPTGDGPWVDFDITKEGVYTLEFRLWRDDTMWVVNNTMVNVLMPANPTDTALPVTVSLAINGITKASNERLWGGSHWNERPGTYFGGTVAWSEATTVSGSANYAIRSYAVPDIVPTIDIDRWGGRAGSSALLGEVKSGDTFTVTYRVGEIPKVRHGHVTGGDYITAADTTMLRRFIAAGQTAEVFTASNPDFNAANADVNGDGKIEADDVTLLRRYLAATNPETVRLGPPMPVRPDPPITQASDRLVAITYDDGPCTNITPQVLTNLAMHTDRHGNTPRVTFYVVGSKINGATVPILQRMIKDGHDVDNHSWDHRSFGNLGGGGHGAPLITTTAEALENINNATEAILEATGFWPWSFRPPFFQANAHMNGINSNPALLKDPDQPRLHFIFGAWLDTDDWNINLTGSTLGNRVLGWRANPPAAHPTPSNGGLDRGIVLFHDLYQWTADAVPHFVPQLQADNHVLVTVRQLFEMKGIVPPPFTGVGTRINYATPTGAPH
jgi:peptidoglycan/xylan/chitin deacetylase (PgdA/CDA1 family)